MSFGPLSMADLLAVWRSVTDPQYWRPLVERPDSGVEVIEQAAEGLARVSLAIDRTTQALFIRTWSGQSDSPASGAGYATAGVRVSRTMRVDRPLILDPGLIVVQVEHDWGPEGPVEVDPGRRYVVTTRAWMEPGDMGPVDVQVRAERPGEGYNAPLPGTLTRFWRSWSSVAAGSSLEVGNRLRMPAGGRYVLAPAHVGQFVEFTSGAPAGQVRRIIGYLGGDPAEVLLDSEWVMRGLGVAGTFVPGETVFQGAVRGRVVAASAAWLVIDSVLGTPVTGVTITGDTSGATFVPDAIDVAGPLPIGLVDWRLLDWVDHLGVAMTNQESPVGGRSPVLDELGDERRVYRLPGELDEPYRARVAEPADTVSPNAVRRAGNAVLEPLGHQVCLREVGGPLLPGLYYDAGSSSDAPQDRARNFAWDLDFAVEPLDRFKLWLDVVEFRAFFLIGVPSLGDGEFGFGWDDAPGNPFDAAAPHNFYDGFPVVAAAIYRAVYGAIDRVRAAGVGFDLYREDLGCV
jgi:hypothetical protein